MSLLPRPSPVWIAALLVVAVGSSSARAASAPPAPSAKVQQRIDTLLKRRLKPEALPIDVPNPFQVITGGPSLAREAPPETITMKNAAGEEIPADPNAPAVAAAPGASTVVPTSLEVLSTVLPRLKIGGVIALKDQLKVVVNGVPRREGEMIPADWNNTVIYLKIVRLLPTQIVFRYGDTEMPLKF